MSDPVVLEFTACRWLSFNRTQYATDVKMNLIAHRGATKLVWSRRDMDGDRQLVQFCSKRGRLNYPTACLDRSERCVCSSYEDASHIVPLSDVDTE